MKKNYLIKFAFAFLIHFNFSARAQNWTVGTPVDMSISYLTKYGFSCAPQPDYNMNIILNSVSGIQYIAIVDSVQDIAIIPSTSDTLMMGDTLFLSPGNNNYAVSFVNGTGSISFNFKAVGTPTTAGESHPCTYSDAWMSNLLLCNEGLTLNVQNTCTVDAATGINNKGNKNNSIQFPSNNNQYQLQLTNLTNSDLISINDITGKLIVAQTSPNSSTLSIPCLDLNSGVYFISITQNNTSSTYKFVINK